MRNASIILAALLASTSSAALAREDCFGSVDAIYSGGPVTTDIELEDDIQACFGGSQEYCWAYDSAATAFELRALDCDGVATPCVSMWTDDGTDDWNMSGGLTLGDRLDMADSSIRNTVTVCREAPLSDLAPTDTVIIAEPNYAQGTQTAARLILAGGDDEMTITVDTTGGNEVGVVVTQTCKGAALAALTEGIDFACSGLSDSACAANLAVAVAAQSGTCVTATSAAAVVYPQPIDCDAYVTSFASTNGVGGGTAFVTNNGTDGVVLIPSHVDLNGIGRIVTAADGADHIREVSSGIGFYANSSQALHLGATINKVGNTTDYNGNYSHDSTQAQRLGGAGAVVNMADTTGFVLVTDEMEVLGATQFQGLLNARAGVSATGVVTATGDIRAGAASKIHLNGRAEFTSPEDGDARLTGSNGSDLDSLQLSSAPISDVAPADSSILFANSWAQASAGDARIGGDGWICMGLGTYQIVCDDYADGALDEMVITTTADGGVVTVKTMIEGTHFDCDTSDEVCCDNLGTRIVTEYGAGGDIVPDCDTTGGTCYLTPKGDLCTVDLSITNSADDPFATLVEGASGVLNLPGVLRHGTHTETIDDDGGGTHATATITPTANFILCDCDDAHGCTITMGETGMVSGMRITIACETATHCDFVDTDSVSNLKGAFQCSDDDTIEMVYSVDEWLEVGDRSDN